MNIDKKRKNLIVNTLRVLLRAAKPLLIFEIFYKTLVVLILKPGLNFIFSTSIKLSGYGVLINEDIVKFLTSFIGIISTLIFMYLAVLIVYYEFAVILLILDRSFEGKTISLRRAMESAFLKIRRFKLGGNFGLALYILVLIPFINIGIQSAFLPSLDIPAFISGEVLKYAGGELIIGTFILLCIGLYAKSFIVLPNMVLEDEDFKLSRKKSFEKMEGKVLGTAILSIIMTFIWMGIALLPSILLENTSGFIFSSLRLLSNLPIIIFSILVSPMILSLMLTIYKPYQENLKNEDYKLFIDLRLNILETKVDIWVEKTKRAWREFIVFIKNNKLLGFFGLLLILIIVYANRPININYNQAKPLVIGHRGSLEGVENSKEAVRASGDMGADYAEIDVLLSKDNIPMVVHDTNLFRLSGKSQKIYDMTGEEIEKIVLKDRGYEGNISSLDKLYDEIGDSVELLIEFKTHGREEKSIVEETMKIVKKHKKEDRTIFQTSDLSILEEFKEKYEAGRIGYIIIGKLGRLNRSFIEKLNADFLVFEESIVNQSIVNTSHILDIPVFVWTVNDYDIADRLYRMGVDGIITDYPSVILEIRDQVYNEKNKN